MSWDDRRCIGRVGRCDGYRGAPCDCWGPWTAEELADAQALLAALDGCWSAHVAMIGPCPTCGVTHE